MEIGNQLVKAVVAGLQEKKGRDIIVVDLTDIQDTVCKYFVICSGGSPAQLHTLTRSVGEASLKQAHEKPLAVDGLQNAQWVAMDYADVIVHIMLPEVRAYYDIEHLWADANLIEIPNLD